jgi:hypothetical protein
MVTQILHSNPFHYFNILLVEPGTMMYIAGGVILAALLVGYYLYSETKKSNR